MSSQVPFLYPLSEDGSPGEPWELDRPSLMVGRGESSDITVFDDALSRGHFLIVREAGEFFVVDLDSQNGKRRGRPVGFSKRLRCNPLNRCIEEKDDLDDGRRISLLSLRCRCSRRW